MYDQIVVKSDKLVICKLLDVVRGSLHVVLVQYQLMGIYLPLGIGSCSCYDMDIIV